MVLSNVLCSFCELSTILGVLQLKGKAAIDVVCNPLGKSGGAFIQQIMIVSFGSLAASTPYLGVILLGIVLVWMGAARSLNKQVSIRHALPLLGLQTAFGMQKLMVICHCHGAGCYPRKI